jgi:hypothetical protein
VIKLETETQRRHTRHIAAAHELTAGKIAEQR